MHSYQLFLSISLYVVYYRRQALSKLYFFFTSQNIFRIEWFVGRFDKNRCKSNHERKKRVSRQCATPKPRTSLFPLAFMTWMFIKLHKFTHRDPFCSMEWKLKNIVFYSCTAAARALNTQILWGYQVISLVNFRINTRHGRKMWDNKKKPFQVWKWKQISSRHIADENEMVRKMQRKNFTGECLKSVVDLRWILEIM